MCALILVLFWCTGWTRFRHTAREGLDRKVPGMFALRLARLNPSREKHYLKTSARESHIVPLHNRSVLTTHGLTEISDLRETFMLFCEFPKTTTVL